MLEINNIKAKSTAILLSVIFIFLILLSVLIIFIRPIKETKLAANIQNVLDQKEEKRYQVGKTIDLQLPIAVSTSFFELTDSMNKGQENFALITRITGINGPMAVVFVGNDNSIEFSGIAGIANTQANPLEYGLTSTMIHHWKTVLSEAYKRGIEKWKKNHILCI